MIDDATARDYVRDITGVWSDWMTDAECDEIITKLLALTRAEKRRDDKDSDG